MEMNVDLISSNELALIIIGPWMEILILFTNTNKI